jgi:hypothetical protein
MLETSSIIAWSSEKPEGVTFGKEYNDGASMSIDPSSFVRPNL